MVLGDTKTCVYQFIFDKKMTVITEILCNILLCMAWYYVSIYTILWDICSMHVN